MSDIETSLICCECGKFIKRNEGFYPNRNFKKIAHAPNCRNPLGSDKVRMYEPNIRREDKNNYKFIFDHI